MLPPRAFAALAICGALVPVRLDAAACDPLPLPARRIRAVRSVAGLEAAVRSVPSGTVIVLEEGTYDLGSTLEILTPGITIRGRSGDARKTVLRGSGMSGNAVCVALAVSAPGVTIAHLSVGLVRCHGIQVRGEAGASGVRVYGVRLFDAGQQLLKGSYAPNAKTADGGLVECSTFEYTDHAPSSYTDGIDLIGVKDWAIRNNRFLRIRGPREQGWSAGPAILVWGGSEGTIVERNVVLDSFRGIALGLGPGAFSTPRRGPTPADHRGGLVRNNVILNLNPWADEGIEANAAPGVVVDFNTVLTEGKLPWSISLRFPQTSGLVRNNLTSGRIVFRDGGTASLQGNVEGADQAWFVDAASGDLRLRRTAVKAIDAGVPIDGVAADFDDQPRVAGGRPDAGAFEHQPPRP